MSAFLIALISIATGISGGVATELSHHKAELAAFALAVAAWVVGQRRLVVSTGRRVKPRQPKTQEPMTAPKDTP